ncbi:hypothetical protein ACFLS4_05550, partial [Bacteroidota bacterium]
YLFIRFLILISFFGCEEKNECEDIYCVNPPHPLYFELINKTTGENLFANGTYKISQIEIINISDNSKAEYDLDEINNTELIRLYSVGWQTEIVNYSIKIENQYIFNLYVDSEIVRENCCSYTRYNEILVEDCEFEFDDIYNIYKILLE